MRWPLPLCFSFHITYLCACQLRTTIVQLRLGGCNHQSVQTFIISSVQVDIAQMDVLSSDQLWWFISESVEDSKYDQTSKPLLGVYRKIPRVFRHLSTPSSQGMPEDYNFWIHSPSMNAAVQLLKDAAIHAMWRLYCQDDPTVAVIVRPTGDPSPNTFKARSSGKSSFADRKKTSGRWAISEVFTRPAIQDVSRYLDPSPKNLSRI